nr:sugar nucleotide-binding protein [Legionella jordanis]
MRILVLGATGMLGSAVFHTFNESDQFEVYGTIRNRRAKEYFPSSTHSHFLTDVDVLDVDALFHAFEKARPDLVINCIGLIKQHDTANDPLVALPINSIFPHRLAKFCALANARLIHVSTDCVFSGRKGLYNESDPSDAEDLYGKSKFIGELADLKHAITIRTSIIGHEINSHHALVDWFLSQEKAVKGYAKAIFSGLPTFELARVMRDYILPRPDLHGLYHVAAKPINKHDLLALVSEIYNKKINIIADEQVVIDRSLNAARFEAATGYRAPSWPELIALMHQSRKLYGVN